MHVVTGFAASVLVCALGGARHAASASDATSAQALPAADALPDPAQQEDLAEPRSALEAVPLPASALDSATPCPPLTSIGGARVGSLRDFAVTLPGQYIGPPRRRAGEKSPSSRGAPSLAAPSRAFEATGESAISVLIAALNAVSAASAPCAPQTSSGGGLAVRGEGRRSRGSAASGRLGSLQAPITAGGGIPAEAASDPSQQGGVRHAYASTYLWADSQVDGSVFGRARSCGALRRAQEPGRARSPQLGASGTTRPHRSRSCDAARAMRAR